MANRSVTGEHRRLLSSYVCLLISLKFVSALAWIPEENHLCNIDRLSWQEFRDAFPRGLPPLFEDPIIIKRNPKRNHGFRLLTSDGLILEQFPPNFNVTLSSSNSISEHRRTIPFAQYLNETIESKETPVDSPSSENWYLFGETYSEEWKELLRKYALPPCRTCNYDDVALSFGIGNRGSGVQWHTHGPGFSEALHGRKHWILYPPDVRPEFNKDQSSRQWMEYIYPKAKPSPYECTLMPGDFIYFPDRWWHATINLDPYTAFVSTFTTEHNAVNEDEL